MAEENKHLPTTEEQTPPEMPGKAPKMEQAEIPDVGGGPAPSAKVIDLSAVRSTPEKDAPTDIPKETEAPSVSVTEYSKREWEKPMPEPEKPKPKRGRPAKAEKRRQLAARKLQVSIHLPCLPLTRSPGNPAKNGGSAVSYAPSVPRFFMIASIIPSTSRSSLSLRELS